MDWEFVLSPTVTGLVVVFAVLVVLDIIIKIAGGALDRASGRGRKKRPKIGPAPAAEPRPAAAPVKAMPEENGDVVAVISAAVAYMMEAEGYSADEYRVTDIRPAKRLRRSAAGAKPRSEWSAAGIRNALR